MPWILMGTVFAGFIVALVISTHILSSHPGPRSRRRLTLFSFYCFVAYACLAVPGQLSRHQFWSAAVWLLLVGSIGYSAFRHPSRKEEEGNYLVDPQHCGRCGYDLTGNVSGVCPECGWRLPASPSKIEDVGWAMWWKRWEIGYLENWRRSLVTMLFWFAVFLGVAAYLVWENGSMAGGVLALVMAAQFAVNTMRVLQYARKQRVGA